LDVGVCEIDMESRRGAWGLGMDLQAGLEVSVSGAGGPLFAVYVFPTLANNIMFLNLIFLRVP
jgi:hypothetical protein